MQMLPDLDKQGLSLVIHSHFLLLRKIKITSNCFFICQLRHPIRSFRFSYLPLTIGNKNTCRNRHYYFTAPTIRLDSTKIIIFIGHSQQSRHIHVDLAQSRRSSWQLAQQITLQGMLQNEKTYILFTGLPFDLQQNIIIVPSSGKKQSNLNVNAPRIDFVGNNEDALLSSTKQQLPCCSNPAVLFLLSSRNRCLISK